MFSFTAFRQLMLALTITAVMLVAGAGSVKAQSTGGPYTTSTPISVTNPSNPSTLGTLAFVKFNSSLGTLIGIKFDIATTYDSQVAAYGGDPSGSSSGFIYSRLKLDLTDASSYISSGTLHDDFISPVFTVSGLASGAFAYSSPGTTTSTLSKTIYATDNPNLMSEFTGSSGTATLSVNASYGVTVYTSTNLFGGAHSATVGVTGQVTYIYVP